jgi:DNA-binding response OmpR family regulator
MTLLQTASTQHSFGDGHLDLDFDRKVVSLDSRRLQLTRKEYDLLAVLVSNASDVVRRDVLLMKVWGYSNQIRTRTLDVHIRRLRKKLGAYSEAYIETIFGVGYRFQPFKVSAAAQHQAPAFLALGA